TALPPPFSTNVPGQYVLAPPWTGKTDLTVKTGPFADRVDPETERLQRALHFDLLLVSGKPSGIQIPYHPPDTEGREFGKVRYTGRFDYVPALPPDGAIRAAATVSDLEKVLPKGKFPGWSAWGEG